MSRILRYATTAALAAALLLTGLLVDAGAAPSPGGSPAGTFNSNITGSVGAPTYSAAAVGLAPAASATDFITLQGGAGKVVRILRAHCTGISTAAGSASVQGVIRSTLNTGTSGRTALTIVPQDPSDAAAVAIAYSYTTNPSPLGTLVGVVRADTFNTSAAAGGGASPLDWDFSAGTDPRQSIVLRSATQLFALNGIAASFVAGTALNCWITWTETVN